MTARRRNILVAGALAGAILASGTWAAYAWFGPAPPRNVILISIDTLRADHLGCYGYGRDTSPTLDRLAREGAVFDHAISSTSWTLPAHAALLTGLPDRVHGCFDERRRLHPSRDTLAEAFRLGGYETAGFFSGPLLHPYFGFEQGFDHYEDCTSYPEQIAAELRGKSFDEGVPQRAHRDVTNARLETAVKRWLDGRRAAAGSRPFFLFAHLWDVHHDYIPPKPYDTMFGDGRNPKPAPEDVVPLVARYDGEIRWTDATIGRILAALEQAGALENTLIVVTADHGEAFFEHGFHSHRFTLHDEEVHVPLIVHDPGRVRGGVRVRHVVSTIDIAPTVLALAGLPPLPHAMGRSLAPWLENPAKPWDGRPAVSEVRVPVVGNHFFALRTGRWKLIMDFKTGLPAIYDLAADPGEQKSLLGNTLPADFPHDAAGLAALYERWIADLDAAAKRLATRARNDRDMPDATRRRLRSLGYLR